MGTPDFAVLPLQRLVEENYNVVGVVTASNKKAGRGQNVLESAVKRYATENCLKILQPIKLKNPDFIVDMEKLSPDLIIVVAFRMLPEIVWTIPTYGTINLHASLLPQYRGAAPINWALINGETLTGVTTFFIDKEIDTGKIIMQKEINISEEDNAKTLHDKLMITGSELVLSTVDKIADGTVKTYSQSDMEKGCTKKAPKINKTDCKIDWHNNGQDIFNFIRGLSPYPGAWTMIQLNEQQLELKIFEGKYVFQNHNFTPGTLEIVNDTIKIFVLDGYYSVLSLQLQSKKRMTTREFINGFGKQAICIAVK